MSRQLSSTLLLFIFIAVFLINSQLSYCQSNSVSSSDFNQAVDAAVAAMVASDTFIKYVNTYLPLSSPTCSSHPSYPSNNPIPSSVTSLKMCYEDAEEIEQVWIDLYKLIGNTIVSNINSNYKLSLTAQFVLVNTTELGYFESMKSSVNDGKCHVIVSDTTITTERSEIVNFASCPYGYSLDAFLRSDLDIDLYPNITSLSQMDSSNFKIGYYLGSSYEDIVNQTFKYAQKVPANYDEQFELVGSKSVHALIADAFDLNKWRMNNQNSCSKCYVKSFGSGSSYGVFTAKVNRSSGATSSRSINMMPTFWWSTLMLLSILIFGFL